MAARIVTKSVVRTPTPVAKKAEKAVKGKRGAIPLEARIAKLREKMTSEDQTQAESFAADEDLHNTVRLAYLLLPRAIAGGLTKREQQTYNYLLKSFGAEVADKFKDDTLQAKPEQET